jgi:hypothetical protein
MATKRRNAMLRELNENEMEMVSGGGDSGDLPPPSFGGQMWEWQWALSDPLVMAQMMGGAGFDGVDSYIVSAEFSTGDIPIVTNSFNTGQMVTTVTGEDANGNMIVDAYEDEILAWRASVIEGGTETLLPSGE